MKWRPGILAWFIGKSLVLKKSYVQTRNTTNQTNQPALIFCVVRRSTQSGNELCFALIFPLTFYRFIFCNLVVKFIITWSAPCISVSFNLHFYRQMTWIWAEKSVVWNSNNLSDAQHQLIFKRVEWPSNIWVCVWARLIFKRATNAAEKEPSFLD